MNPFSPDPLLARLITPREHAAAMELVRRVRRGVPAELWRALLFGSRARGQGRPASDLDVLLVFDALPRDREPQAGIAEWIAEEVAEESGVPVTVWSVSRGDLERGRRTPMLVDALDDGIPLWPAGAPKLRVDFTPEDALFCTGQLLDRVEEGSAEVEDAVASGEWGAAARRARDDLVRLCTAALLLEGVTRPRTAECVACFTGRHGPPWELVPVLRWAADSFGADGKERAGPIAPPPGGLGAVAHAVEALRGRVMVLRRELAEALGEAG
jgi:Nucleotidyltransferase domain